MMDYLLVEHKDRCWDCDLMRIEEMHEIAFCGRTGGKVVIDGKPDWCPLRPLPEFKDDGELVTYISYEPLTEELEDRLIDFGYNECLHEITGEVEE